jgi:hypothetical protein
MNYLKYESTEIFSGSRGNLHIFKEKYSRQIAKRKVSSPIPNVKERDPKIHPCGKGLREQSNEANLPVELLAPLASIRIARKPNGVRTYTGLNLNIHRPQVRGWPERL